MPAPVSPPLLRRSLRLQSCVNSAVLIAEWKHMSTISTSTADPALPFEDEANLSVSNTVSHESHDVSLDKSNHGFSFDNVHWASFSSGLSSVLAVLVACLLIAGCYFRGRRQCQSHARHTELLHSIASGASRHISAAPRIQSGLYPGSSPSAGHPSVHSSGTVTYPVTRFSSPPASCGLPDCSTSYERPATVSFDSLGHSRHLPLTYESASTVALVDRLPSAPPSSDRRLEPVTRQTETPALHG